MNTELKRGVKVNMYHKLKIKSQILLMVGIFLSFIILLQIFLYTILQHENKKTIFSIVDSVSQNTIHQINTLHKDIEDICSSFSLQELVQDTIYNYTLPEIVTNVQKVYNLLEDYRERNQNIAFLGLYRDSSIFLSNDQNDLHSIAYNITQKYSSGNTHTASFAPSFIHNGRTYFAYLLPAFSVDISKAYYGSYVICIYEMNSISYAPYNFIQNNEFDLIITDKENHVLLSSNPDEHGQAIDLNEKTKKMLTKTGVLKDLEWNVTIYTSNNSILSFTNYSFLFITFMIITTIGILFLMFILLNNIIVKKILILNKKVRKISTQDTSYRIDYDYDDELSEIVSAINHSLNKIYLLNQEKINIMDNLYNVKLMQKETHILYLHSQVSPHFLYNSLSHIQGIALRTKQTEICQMLSSLSKVFRYYSNNGTHSTIYNDLDYATEYFNCINLRRENSITLINTVDKELYCVPCLKMIYQPILENVLKHAFELEESGKVIISSMPDEIKAIIEIKDNGHGIPDDILADLEKQMTEIDLSQISKLSEHVGLVNVNLRLKLYYNSECGIQILPQEHGIVIRIIFDKKLPDSSLLN